MKENPQTMNRTVSRRHKYAAAAGTLALGLALTACGSSHSSTSSSGTSGSSSSSAHRFKGSFPGAVGSVTSVTDSSMVVKGQSDKVTVSWTSATTFSQAESKTKDALTSGTCVTIAGSKSGSKLKARTVTISSPVNGECTLSIGGFGGGSFGGAGGGQSGGSRPSGTFPSGGKAPSGAKAPSGGSSRSGGRGGFSAGSFATGKVTSRHGDQLVISGHTGFVGNGTSKAIKITLASSTTYSETAKVTSKSLAVGDCVTATGKSASKTAVKASTVRITSTGGKSCTAGFGSFGRRTNG